MIAIALSSHIEFVHEKRHMDIEGGGLAPVTFLGEKSWKFRSYDSLLKIFNILKSSIKSIQNPASSLVYLYFKYICMLIVRTCMALPQLYF